MYGIDLISIVNKVNDFNKKEEGSGEINYDQIMTVEISGLDEFDEDYNTKLFDGIANPCIINKDSDMFTTAIEPYREIEAEFGIKVTSTIASNRANLENYYKDSDTDNGKTLAQVLGKNQKTINNNAALSEIEAKFKNTSLTDEERFEFIDNCSAYSEFKSAKFRSAGEPEYEDGQISKLSFEYVSD